MTRSRRVTTSSGAATWPPPTRASPRTWPSRRGDRVADLACGTGVYTLEMARLTDPGEVVAVDYSEGMLAAARERLEDEGYPSRSCTRGRRTSSPAPPPPASTWCRCASPSPTSTGARCCPQIGRMLRPGGRVGVLTSVNSSMPQLYTLFDRYRSSAEPVWKLYKHCGKNIGETWRFFRRLRETFAHGRFISVPATAEQVAGGLAAGGLVERRRLDGDGAPVVRVRAAPPWTGRAAPATPRIPRWTRWPPATCTSWRRCSRPAWKDFREPGGIPLDLVVGGVVARKA